MARSAATLVLIMRAEPDSLAGTILVSTDIGTGSQRRRA